MPNWVYNTMTINGDKDDVAKFAKQASKPALFTSEGESTSEFSFANFIHPPQHALESGEYWATNGFQGGETVGNTPNNWYNWNNKYWGTKWDACEPDVMSIDDTLVTYSFNTAWAPPMPVFEAMVRQFPRLGFFIRYEEEQGWGGSIEASGGAFGSHEQWEMAETIDVVAGL